jgi:serine phosphatase RsbU (regulator of sigma subunit)
VLDSQEIQLDAGVRRVSPTDSLDRLLRRARRFAEKCTDGAHIRTERQLVDEFLKLVYAGLPGLSRAHVCLLGPERPLSVLYTCNRSDTFVISECGGLDALPTERREELSRPRLFPGEGATSSMLSVPILGGGVLLGLMVLVATRGQEFNVRELEVVSEVAIELGQSHQRHRASQRQLSERLRQLDLENAQRLQRSFLPPSRRSVAGFQVAAEYRPALGVGGDLYELVSLRPGHLMAVIGDVSGKGIAAALVMARVATEIRHVARHSASPGALLDELNASLNRDGCDDAFVTLACVELDTHAGCLTLANAGHVPPLLRRRSGDVLTLGRSAGPPLGVWPSQRYGEDQYPLGLDDLLLLYTDGVSEPFHADSDPIGSTALHRLLATAPDDASGLNRRLVEALEQHTGGTRLDDFTSVVVRAARDAWPAATGADHEV